jgi:hypothetical protein
VSMHCHTTPPPARLSTAVHSAHWTAGTRASCIAAAREPAVLPAAPGETGMSGPAGARRGRTQVDYVLTARRIASNDWRAKRR